MKHTPGPWKVGTGELECVALSPKGHSVADCDFDLPNDEAKANARLIAAAPDMLEALQEAENCLSFQGVAEKKVLKMLKQAIAKAGGK